MDFIRSLVGIAQRLEKPASLDTESLGGLSSRLTAAAAREPGFSFCLQNPGLRKVQAAKKYFSE